MIATRRSSLNRRKPAFNPRTNRLSERANRATLLLLAWPNVLVMVAQASTGLIETWFISRFGTDALAGMALVFPGRDADADDLRRRHGRRHLVGDCARAWAPDAATTRTRSFCTR